MDEDLLSPELGRLIDVAKAAAGEGPAESRLEGVALLTEEGIYPGRGEGGAGCRAALEALDAWHEAGEDALLAAAVASSDTSVASVLPCPTCRAALAAVDPELPLVIKRKGRWVLTPLSWLPPAPSEECSP